MKNWDQWYLEICNVVAKKSSCLSRQVGSVLVRDKSIISTGYNGPPRGVPHCNERYLVDNKLRWAMTHKGLSPDDKKYHNICPRQVLGFKSGLGLHLCQASHSERNACINAARNGISTKGTMLYMSCGIPCKDCLVELINFGVEEIIVTKLTYYDELSEWVLKNSNLKYRLYNI